MSAEAHREGGEARALGGGARARLRPGGSNPLWGACAGGRIRAPHTPWLPRHRPLLGRARVQPTQVHRHRAEAHGKLAREHEASARALEEFEEASCQAFPKEIRRVCFLVTQAESFEDAFGGVRVRLAEEANVNAAVTHMRCHQAFARARGREGMDTCPLYMPGVWVERVGTTREVDLLALDPDEVGELRRRARAHLGMEAQR